MIARLNASLLLAAVFVVASSPDCFAQKAVSDNEAYRLANAKFRVVVTLGDARQECAAPRAMVVNDRISKGQSREEAESSIDKNFTTLMANDAADMGSLARLNASRLAVPFSNFIVCVTQTSNLQRLKIGEDMTALAHIKTAGSAPTGGGRYTRISQTQWSLLRDEDDKKYSEFLRSLLFDESKQNKSGPHK